MIMDTILAILPLIPSLALIPQLPAEILRTLGLSCTISNACFILGCTLIPVVGSYTSRRGISGKDMGKKGSLLEGQDVPEALGIVSGVTYLIAAIISQLLFAVTYRQQVIYNSALFSICFMIFLGFTDDVLDLKWRYKLILPTVASLPLLSAYSGSTAVYIPQKLQHLIMYDNKITIIGNLIGYFAVVDSEAHGAIVELGYLFLVFMGLLSVFCTNAINIYAGINGLECGQAYIIASSILFFKLYEIGRGEVGENQIFTVVMVLPFIGASLSLLRSNWYPARVFVGDTYCYFAGMTFAVLGIHGHFSKTLLLLFLPQIINFLYSIPQLFKILPCPRHRLPRVDPATHLLTYSAFPCSAIQYRALKVTTDSIECPNLTLICLALRFTGPLRERSLCILLLGIQVLTSVLTFYIRYHLLEDEVNRNIRA